MIRISEEDFKKLVSQITKVGQPGAILSFTERDRTLVISTVDRNGKDITMELTDTRYSMFPRITRTETF